MKLNIQISDLTFEELIMLSRRICEPSFNEIIDADETQFLGRQIEEGKDLLQAKEAFNQHISKKEEDVKIAEPAELRKMAQAPEPEVKTEIQQLESEPQAEQLHLDGPPPVENKPETVTMDELIQFAREIFKNGGMDKVRNIIAGFGVKKIKDLEGDDIQKAYDLLKKEA